MGMPDHSVTSGPLPPRDTESFGRSLETVRPYLLQVANHELNSDLLAKGGASDLVQETFLDAHRDPSRFEGRTRGEFRAWLRRILLNNLANFARRYRKSQKTRVDREISLDQETPSGHSPCELAASMPSPSEYAVQNERAQVITQALARLPERDRRIIRWRHQDHCSFEEIGQRLGGSADMARKAWVRALDRLRDEVGPLD